jgi:hypothetical protein
MYYELGTPECGFNITHVNKFAAAHDAAAKDLDMRFNMYDSEFDKCDWSKDPELSWDNLLDIRAQQIAAKGKPVVLNFSGGTDSYTIYKVFERNKLRIDAVFLKIRETEPDASRMKQVYELLNAGLYDPTIKIITWKESGGLIDSYYDSPDWIWEGGDRTTDNYVASLLGTDDFVSIIGLEKPRLWFDHTGVYSYQDDENFVRAMPSKTIDCFYISPDLPELHIKQSYILKNYIKTLLPGAGVAELSKYNNIHNPTTFDWHLYSFKGCGRFGDLNASHLQHQATARTNLEIPKIGGDFIFNGMGADWFKALAGSKTLKNYTDGIMSVVHDAAADYLHVKRDNFYGMRLFKSKHYKMTF